MFNRTILVRVAWLAALLFFFLLTKIDAQPNQVTYSDENFTKDAKTMELCCSLQAGEERRPPDIYIPLSSELDLEYFSVYNATHVSWVKHPESENKVQKVFLPEGQHYGMEMQYDFDGAEQVSIRWKQYLPEHWNPAPNNHIKFPGIGNRDRHGWGGRQTDGTGGWSVRTGLRNSPEHDKAVVVEFYVYHMGMGRWGSLYTWDTDENGAVIYREEWTQLEIFVRVNTPGESDGIIRGFVNGEQRYEKSDLRFRADGFDQYDIQEIIWHIYHGGAESSPADQHMYFSDLEIWVGEF